MNSTQDSLKKITKGAGIIFVGMIISKLLGYVYRILIARVGTETYGLFSIGIALFSLLTTISLVGLNRGVLRYISFYRAKEDLGKVKELISFSLKITSLFSLIVSIIFFVFSDKIAILFFHNSDLSIIFKILAVFIPFSVFREVIFSIIESFQKIKYEIYSKNIVENVIKILLTLIFLTLGFKLIGFTVAYAIGILISTLTALFFLKKLISIKLNLNPSKILKKELFFYSFPLSFSLLISSIINWTDTLMLGFFRTASEIGIYNAALSTAFLMYIIPSILLGLFIPILTEVYAKDDKDSFNQIHKRVTKWILFTNIALLSLFYLFSKPILRILFGLDYVSGSTVLIILSTGYFIGYSLSASTRVLMIINKTKLIFINTLAITIINIILNLYLIPIYGISGAAIATASAFMIRSILLLIESIIILKVVPFNIKHLGILFSALISFLLIKILLPTEISLINLVLFSLLFLVVYVISLILTRSLEKEDLSLLGLMDGFKKS